jgi:prepilin-type processing-associated H-X9-DG protein
MMHTRLSGRALGDIHAPSCVGLICDGTTLGGEFVGSEPAARHLNGYIAAYADGHVAYNKKGEGHFGMPGVYINLDGTDLTDTTTGAPMPRGLVTYTASGASVNAAPHNGLTVAFWFRSMDAGGPRNTPFLSAPFNAWRIYHYADRTPVQLSFEPQANSGSIPALSLPVPFKKWMHVAFVAAKGQPTKVYVNGVLKSQSASVATGQTKALSGTFALYSRDTDSNAAGDICGLRIYQRGLKPEEVSGLYL